MGYHIYYYSTIEIRRIVGYSGGFCCAVSNNGRCHNGHQTLLAPPQDPTDKNVYIYISASQHKEGGDDRTSFMMTD